MVVATDYVSTRTGRAMMRFYETCALLAVVLLLSASSAMATIYFGDGGIHDIDYSCSDLIVVDYQLPGLQTTLNVLEGGRPDAIEGYGDSVINFYGGAVMQALFFDNSQVNVYGGNLGGRMFLATVRSISTMARLG